MGLIACQSFSGTVSKDSGTPVSDLCLHSLCNIC
jgi:hypothetical protein